jgi:hypothetical protein
VPRDQHALPGREVPEDLAADLFGAAAEALDGPVARGRRRHHPQRLHFLHEDADGLFEFEKVRHAS